jgi:hypothetical protein
VFHPLKVKPLRVKEFAVNAVPALAVWFDIDPVPPFASKVTVYVVGALLATFTWRNPWRAWGMELTSSLYTARSVLLPLVLVVNAPCAKVTVTEVVSPVQFIKSVPPGVLDTLRLVRGTEPVTLEIPQSARVVVGVDEGQPPKGVQEIISRLSFLDTLSTIVNPGFTVTEKLGVGDDATKVGAGDPILTTPDECAGSAVPASTRPKASIEVPSVFSENFFMLKGYTIGYFRTSIFREIPISWVEKLFR